MGEERENTRGSARPRTGRRTLRVNHSQVAVGNVTERGQLVGGQVDPLQVLQDGTTQVREAASELVAGKVDRQQLLAVAKLRHIGQLILRQVDIAKVGERVDFLKGFNVHGLNTEKQYEEEGHGEGGGEVGGGVKVQSCNIAPPRTDMSHLIYA